MLDDVCQNNVQSNAGPSDDDEVAAALDGPQAKPDAVVRPSTARRPNAGRWQAFVGFGNAARRHGAASASATKTRHAARRSILGAYCFKPDVTCEDVGGRGLFPPTVCVLTDTVRIPTVVPC